MNIDSLSLSLSRLSPVSCPNDLQEKEKCESLERAIEEAQTRLKAFDEEKGSSLENWHEHTCMRSSHTFDH
jgi:hypothetical protein